MNILSKMTIAAVLVALAACGRSEPGRVEGGAAAGAASGATIGLVGGPVGVAVGAAVGGGVGAVTGATTPARDVNLGTPVWDKRQGQAAAPVTP
jgi:phage tail tape-measure protein